MTTKFLLSLIAVFSTLAFSLSEYNRLKGNMDIFVRLNSFSHFAESNLHTELRPISDILSEVFNIRLNDSMDFSLLEEKGLSITDTENLIDYTIKYNYLNIEQIRNETQKLIRYTEQRLDEEKQRYHKKLPSLLCPPVCAIILVLLII